MRILALTLSALIAVLLTGCDENAYEIVLRPQGHDIQRELTCWRWDP